MAIYYLLNDWVIGCGCVVFDSVNRLKWTLCLGRDAIVCLVVRIKTAVCLAGRRVSSN